MVKDEFSVKETYDALFRQLNLYWYTELPDCFMDCVEIAIKKTKTGWDMSSRKYYLSRGFSILNTSVYAVFLYYLGHYIGNQGEVLLADKLYYLNKIMNSVEWYWNIQLPEHFIVEHPIGSVLGKGNYGDYFSIYQGVTVGERLKKDINSWPTFGHHVIMFAHSSIIGDCNIGNWVILSAGSMVINEDIPDCSIVFGQSPRLVIKPFLKNEIKEYFTKSWKLQNS